MKRLLATLIFLTLTVSPVRALEDWQIDRFEVHMQLNSNGELYVEETINADFGILEKHGIFRDVPFKYLNSLFHRRDIEIDIEKVAVDGQATKFEAYESDGNLRIKIGDPLRTISGEHTYTIGYTVSGAVNFFDTHDELFWNVTGNDWPVGIEKVTVEVDSPAEATSYQCFTGLEGSRSQNCRVEERVDALLVEAQGLSPGEGLTVVLGYPVGTIEKPPWWQTLGRMLLHNLGYLIPVVVLLVLLRKYWFHGRDTYAVSRYDDSKDNVVMPLFATSVIADRYYPPKGVSAAEAGVVIDETVNHQDIAAILVAMAEKGMLQIIEDEKGKFVFRKVKRKDEIELRPYEETMLDALFKNRDEVALSSLKYTFAATIEKVSNQLYRDVVSSGYFVKQPDSVRKLYLSMGGVLVLVGGILIALGSGWFTGISFGVGVVISGILCMIFAKSMPKRTSKGRQVLMDVLGLKRVIKLGAYRQELFEKYNYFNEILPYAIAFGLTKQWAKAVADLDITPPNWYTGSGSFNPALFGKSMTHFSHTSASTMTAVKSTNASRGSSGFSGGSSGGGFGGGGGGSW